MQIRSLIRAAALAALALNFLVPPSPAAEDESAAVRKSSVKVAELFNAGKTADIAALFLPQGELIDEQGTVYQGRQEIEDLLKKFFERFPGSKMVQNIEVIRRAGPIAIEEGTRTITSADGSQVSRFRYIAVWADVKEGWRLTSYRDFADDASATPHDNLKSLEWIVGDWVNQGADGTVSIAYRWSDDQNYLLGEFDIALPEGKPRKSTQRIGWDPSRGRIHSWLFDADGGFAEGEWTVSDDGIVIKSSSVNPDGTTATSTMYIDKQDKDHFTIEGADRVVGDALEEDFKITIARRPPAAGK